MAAPLYFVRRAPNTRLGPFVVIARVKGRDNPIPIPISFFNKPSYQTDDSTLDEHHIKHYR